ncbi:hypothetical protein J2S00_001807 [Caldalkalibacillus uzonensis]|uniref:Uncharacterized protein n=1 Tax=Caldalkalibacillus uzonensis TaxID=353224 RepID=A0ABU0CRH0_9BACI|nr:helix-turn-helix domain-containing protein [Caldalkalibacillus uzonensis]MDQ0339021.1 hypothetical protein [Caldalkalibacillus uzonensis]
MEKNDKEILIIDVSGYLKSLKPKYRGGCPRTFTEELRAAIIELAQIPPKTLGLPFTGG